MSDRDHDKADDAARGGQTAEPAAAAAGKARGGQPATNREARLAAALRANLVRRKAASRRAPPDEPADA